VGRLRHLGSRRTQLLVESGRQVQQNTGAWRQWTQRIDVLIPAGTETKTFSVSRLFPAIYPEAIKIAALFGSLHWRRLAAGDPSEQQRFATAIGQRLGQPGYRPMAVNDPIAHWIEQDCWQPPSLPTREPLATSSPFYAVSSSLPPPPRANGCGSPTSPASAAATSWTLARTYVAVVPSFPPTSVWPAYARATAYPYERSTHVSVVCRNQWRTRWIVRQRENGGGGRTRPVW
jgi:hypothetical protein